MQATAIQDLGSSGDAGNLPRSAQVRSNQAPAGAESRPEIRLLLVEDDLAFDSVLTRFLMAASRAKFRVTHAGTKAAALERLAALEFDVVLLDLTLSDSPKEATFQGILDHAPNLPIVIMSGSELKLHLQQLPEFKQLPIIYFSAIADDKNDKEVFIGKPIEVQRIIEVIDQQLSPALQASV